MNQEEPINNIRPQSNIIQPSNRREISHQQSLQLNQSPPNANRYIESAPDNFSYSPPNPRMQAPYGMRFGEEGQFRQREQAQYKQDLDYLCSLRRSYGEMSQKEWEEYNRKINYMNDRYAYGELDKRNFLRGMNRGYEDEANMRREKERRRKMEEAEMDRKRLEGIKRQEEMEYQMRQEQKKRLLNEQLNDLDRYNRKKELDNMKKAEEGKENLKLFDEENQKWLDPYNQYKNKLDAMNNKIYGNVYKYNDFLHDPISKDAFKAKNDFEFNRMIAEQRERDRENQRKNPLGLEQRLKDMENQKELDRQFQKEKQNNQKLYKDYLDNQNEVNYLAKLNKPPEDTRPQLLMPAYWYPNRPIPLHKKAKDSLLFSKNPNNYFDKDMNRFFHWDSQYNTLMDYDNSGKYLGDSRLRHNPITCPVNDYYYNKYVNRLKKNSEYVPNPNSRSAGNIYNGSVNPNKITY